MGLAKEKKEEEKVGRQARQMIVVLVVSLILTGAYFWFVYKPLYRDYKQVREEYGKLSEEVAKLRTTPLDRGAASDRRKARNVFEKVKEQFDEVKAKRLASTEERLTLRSQINEMAGSYGLEVKGQDPLDAKELAKRKIRPDPKSVKLGRAYFQMIMRGPFSGVLNLLEDLNSMPKLVTIERVAIRQQEDGTPFIEMLLVI